MAAIAKVLIAKVLTDNITVAESLRALWHRARDRRGGKSSNGDSRGEKAVDEKIITPLLKLGGAETSWREISYGDFHFSDG